MSRHLPPSAAQKRTAAFAAQQRAILRDQVEFAEKLGRNSEVVLEPGYDQDEFFDDQFERRAGEIQRTPKSTNAVSVIPAKGGPWSGNNQLGIERPFAPDINNLQTILKLDEWGFPELWTLALGLTVDDSHVALSSFDVTALVQFGVGGVVQTLEMDWLQGSSITLPMNALNLVALYANELAGEFATTIPSTIRLRASLSKGSGAINARPTRSHRLNPEDVAVTTLPIPSFTKRLGLIPPANGITSFGFYTQVGRVSFNSKQDGSGVEVAGYEFPQFAAFIDNANTRVCGIEFLPIPPFARSIKFLGALDAPTPFNGTVQFELGL